MVLNEEANTLAVAHDRVTLPSCTFVFGPDGSIAHVARVMRMIGHLLPQGRRGMPPRLRTLKAVVCHVPSTQRGSGGRVETRGSTPVRSG